MQHILAMRNNDTQHVVRLSRTLPEQTVLRACLRSSEEAVAHEQFSSFALARGIVGKFATLLLLPMIFFYPLAPVYAADETATSSIVTETPLAPARETTTPADSLAADLGSAVSGAAASVASLFAGEDSTTSAATLVASDTVAISTTSETVATTTGDSTATTTDSDAVSTTTTPFASSTSLVSGDSNHGDAASSTDTASSTADIAETTASSTEVVAPVKTAQEIAGEMLREKEDSLRASIRKEVEDEYAKGCVSLDSTGYYCLKNRDSGMAPLAPSSAVTAVRSDQDSGGQYKQIFMTRGGEEVELTHDAWDNAFPAMDVAGHSIVWQGNVNGRWQIFFANTTTLGTSSVIQVTHSNESNFNPKVDGNDIVWQGWVDGNWEVFLAEHLASSSLLAVLPRENTELGIDNTWKVTRITTNSVHDMFPAVAGGLVTWQSFQDNAWNVYVYSMKTGATQKISEGGEKSEQPRFAITWDQRSDSGDARMVGYDIATGKTIDLTNEARQVNDEKSPYRPSAPISQPDQAALPIASATGTSTNMKEGGDGSLGNDLGI